MDAVKRSGDQNAFNSFHKKFTVALLAEVSRLQPFVIDATLAAKTEFEITIDEETYRKQAKEWLEEVLAATRDALSEVAGR